MSSRKHRDRTAVAKVVAFSISYQREPLLARGFGIKHLHELLVRLARPLIRSGASLAYGGHWKETEDNFTFPLLHLISGEQEDNSAAGPDASPVIGGLINHSAWPYYLEITPRVEAQWINCCRIVRITQAAAGVDAKNIVPDAEAKSGSDAALFNTALTLSTMRLTAARGTAIPIPDASPEMVPPVSARVVLGGKLDGYRGFAPGLVEESLLTLESSAPLFVLGGFGGAGEAIARLFLTPSAPPPELTLDWQMAHNADLERLAELGAAFGMPAHVRGTRQVLEAIHARASTGAPLSSVLSTGLGQEETREMLETRDMDRAVQLVRQGLQAQLGVGRKPA